MKDMTFITIDNASTFYVGTNFYDKDKKPYTKTKFRKISYSKGESSDSKPFKKEKCWCQ